MDKKKLGLYALIGAIASLVIMLLFSATFGLIIYIASFILAVVDLVKTFKLKN